ncbi:MAG: 2-oxoadipate dioxygenase/decarboxylase family protein [Sphingobium phenoxybenzoativorans]
MTSVKLAALLNATLGEDTAAAIDDIVIPAGVADSGPDSVTRAEFAVAMTVALHWGLLQRVPTGEAYAADCRAAGRKIMLDHGALRTIALPGGAPTGAIPAGVAAFSRILEPLGYVVADAYPLERLRMTGFAYCHQDAPDEIAQFFISELHVDRFDGAFADAAGRVFGTTADPLDAAAREALAVFARDGKASLDVAMAAMPSIVGAFDRHHALPSLADYEVLKGQSAEAAWIATEGNAFNHGTDRVENVDSVADAQRALGRAMKDKVEVSGSGRVRQTAYRADWVERDFTGEAGEVLTLKVPGSFYEFIDRAKDPESGKLDLKFDSANAQGIFKMTASLDA